MTWDGKKLEYALASVGLNQVQLAEKLGVEPPTVSRWVNNENAPKKKHMPLLTSILNKPVEYFFQSEPLPTAILEDMQRRLKALESDPNELKSEMLWLFGQLGDKDKKAALNAVRLLFDSRSEALPDNRKVVAKNSK